VIGAGDFIGGEIAKKFAAEGFTIFAGRRNGEKLAPLVKEIEAAGGEIHARSLDARKEEESSLPQRCDKHAPMESASSTSVPTSTSNPRHHRARVPEGLGDGLLFRLPGGPARRRG